MEIKQCSPESPIGKERVKDFLKFNENDHTTVLRGKLIALNAYTKKPEKYHTM